MNDANRPIELPPQKLHAPDADPPSPVRTRGHWAGFGIIAVLLAGTGLLSWTGCIAPTLDAEGEVLHYGYWSLLPPLVAIVLAFWLREVITALLVGIFLGGLIVGDVNIIQRYLLPSVGSTDYAMILLVYLWALGGLIGIWTRTAGATYFADWAAERMVVGRRSAKFFTWLMGLVFHQGGTISTVLTGATVRSIGDRHKVSHEELSYLVDSTASPAAALIPFNVWPIFIAGTVAGAIPPFTSTLADEVARNEQQIRMGVSFFFRAIPFNFFAILTILMTFLLAVEKLPWMGRRMRAAVKRVKTTGQLDRPGAMPMASAELTEVQVPPGYRPGLIDFFGPIGTLLGIAVIPYVIMVSILGLEFSMMIAEAFVLAVLAGFAIAVVKGMPLRTAMDGFINGCKGVTVGALILALAVTLKTVGESVGVAVFITGAFEDIVGPAVLPSLFMLLCMLIAFSTGTSFGTYAIVFPIAMPLAWAVGGESVFFVTICFSAVVGGGIFGDKCSPISDTTILSSLATGCDLMDHVYTQLPLALAAAFVSMVFYTLLVLAYV
jgi:Na+/H+ antiporter NhaC